MPLVSRVLHDSPRERRRPSVDDSLLTRNEARTMQRKSDNSLLASPVSRLSFPFFILSFTRARGSLSERSRTCPNSRVVNSRTRAQEKMTRAPKKVRKPPVCPRDLATASSSPMKTLSVLISVPSSSRGNQTVTRFSGRDCKSKSTLAPLSLPLTNVDHASILK